MSPECLVVATIMISSMRDHAEKFVLSPIKYTAYWELFWERDFGGVLGGNASRVEY